MWEIHSTDSNSILEIYVKKTVQTYEEKKFRVGYFIINLINNNLLYKNIHD